MVKEALWLASPELVQLLAKPPDSPESAKSRKLERALYRYLARMAARATPFGTFAACSVGKVAGETHLELAPRGQYRRRSRLDMEYLVALTESVIADPAAQNHLCFQPNSTLHLAAGTYHHLSGQLQEWGRRYELVATEPTPILMATLRRAARGATGHSLAAAVVEDDPQITQEEAERFLARVIESQILVSDLTPAVTGEEPAEHIIHKLEQAEQPELAATLRKIRGELGALDSAGLSADIGAYEAICDSVARLPGQFKPGRLIQVDTVKPAPRASLHPDLVEDILRAAQILHSMHGQTEQTVFQQFKEDFRERYQEREVSLLEALDDEAGIGFESGDNAEAEPQLEGIDFRRASPAFLQAQDRKPGPILLRRLQETWAAKNIALPLDEALLDELQAVAPLPLPISFSVMGACFPAGNGEHGFCFGSVMGVSGANLAARFCHADERIAEGVKNHVLAEEAACPDDAVFAEIAHLPEGRAGNVIIRPALRKYEVPFLATPGLPPERQIALSDLTVSLVDDRIVLRSQRLQREVLPRLTTAHNFAGDRSLKLYKFLGLLQYQDVTADFAWDWGALDQAAFLPRVVLGNVVFSLARWRITQEDKALLGAGEDSERLRRVREWRKARQVPRFACISELDNQLLIDFENELAVEVFLEQTSKNAETLLVEMFPAPGELPVHGPEGSFAHEIILPFVRQVAPAQSASLTGAPAVKAAPMAGHLRTSFLPGSEWLHAKLYCSPSHADRLLLDLVQPLVEELMAAGSADSWFFIRYSDPRWHLRLRLHGNPAALSFHALPRLAYLAAEQQRQGTLWKMQLDTYERETDRYGGPQGIILAEQLFQWDSELCLALLRLLIDAGEEKLRWNLAFRGADRMFSGLGFTLEQKKAETERLARFREQDYAVDTFYKKQVARKFREQRETLAALLGQETPSGNRALIPDAVAAYERFSEKLGQIRRQFEARERSGQLTKPLREFAESFVHMHLNRMFRSSALTQETLVYEFLSRMYGAMLAQGLSDPSLQ